MRFIALSKCLLAALAGLIFSVTASADQKTSLSSGLQLFERSGELVLFGDANAPDDSSTSTIQNGDVLIAVNDVKTLTAAAARKALDQGCAMGQLIVEIKRKSQSLSIPVSCKPIISQSIEKTPPPAPILSERASKQAPRFVVFLVDKSKSMAFENKLEMMRQSVVESLELLRPEDKIAVVAFDVTPFILLLPTPLRRAESVLRKRLGELTAVGSTNLTPAVATVRNMFKKFPESEKTLLIITDGAFKNEAAGLVPTFRELRTMGITVHALALGETADLLLLNQFAKIGNGTATSALNVESALAAVRKIFPKQN